MNRAQMLLQELGLPMGDRRDLPSSTARFPDGAHYRIEIPSADGDPDGTRARPPGADRHGDAGMVGVTVHRVSQGSGIMLLSDAEVRDMARLGIPVPVPAQPEAER